MKTTQATAKIGMGGPRPAMSNGLRMSIDPLGTEFDKTLQKGVAALRLISANENRY